MVPKLNTRVRFPSFAMRTLDGPACHQVTGASAPAPTSWNPGHPPGPGAYRACMAPRSRAAEARDVEEICLSLPEVTFGTSWGDVPTFLVPHRDKGRGFVLYRKPHKTAVDPGTGEPYDDLLVIRTANASDKAELVDDPSTPFFTVPHFNGFNAVLVQQSRLGEVTYDELKQIITDAWRACASKKLVKEFDAARS